MADALGTIECTIENCLTDRDGSLVMALRAHSREKRTVEQILDEVLSGRTDPKKRLIARFEWFKEKRSKDANAYFHVLATAIAKATRQSLTEVKRQLVFDYGTLLGVIALESDMRPEKAGVEYAKAINDFVSPKGKIGMSSSDLANHLTYNSAKTATEVRAEQDTTETSVNNKRALANVAINAMFEDVARFYGFSDTAEIEWGRAGVNSSTENKELLEDYRAGTLPLNEYLKRRWSDLSEEEIDSWVKEITKTQKANAFGSGAFNDSNYFGG